MTPDLHESLWTRATEKSAGVFKSAAFGIVLTIVEAVVVPISVLFTAHSSRTEVQIVVPILAGAFALALSLLGVVAVRLIAAPIEQRNELRAGWPTDPVEPGEALNLDLKLLNFARVGSELATEMERREKPSPRQRAEAEQWTNEIVAFLESHDPAGGREFLESAKRWGDDPEALSFRIAEKAKTLRQIADRVSAEAGTNA